MADRLDTIARSFFTYVSTDPGVRAALARAPGDAGVVDVINANVTAGAPLTTAELPTVRTKLQALTKATGEAAVEPWESEVLQAIGVHRGGA